MQRYTAKCKTAVNCCDPCEGDVVTYNAAVSACLKGGEWSWCYANLANMADGLMDLGNITYNATFSA